MLKVHITLTFGHENEINVTCAVVIVIIIQCINVVHWFKCILFKYNVYRIGLGAAQSATLPSPKGGDEKEKQKTQI